MRAILIVLDSLGIGEAPDAADYGDRGANTLAHMAAAAGGLHAPVLGRLGLGNMPGLLNQANEIAGLPPVAKPDGCYGAMREMSKGKDTITGHWEMAGIELTEGLALFPHDTPSFPPQLIAEFERRTGRKVIGNKAASGTAVIAELGPEQMKTGAWIVYTSADSVFQIAAHEQVIPLPELYRGCEIARELCTPYRVGRVIARPYVGKPGAFTRTENRRDYPYPVPEATIMDKLSDAGIPAVSVGKIDDIFAQHRFSRTFHSESNVHAEESLLEAVETVPDGLIFVNFIDFDMQYGHRRDAAGYARAIERTDAFLGKLLVELRQDDLLIITADHGNDPTFHGTDHTREYVPLLVHFNGRPPYPDCLVKFKPGSSLGIRHGFYDIAQSLAAFFRLAPMPRGKSFLL